MTDEKIDDYTSYERRDGKVVSTPEHETRVMVVRPGSKYGTTEAWGRVRVPAKDLLDKTTARALMTPAEANDLEAEREKRRLAKLKPKSSKIRDMVNAAINAIPPREMKPTMEQKLPLDRAPQLKK